MAGSLGRGRLWSAGGRCLRLSQVREVRGRLSEEPKADSRAHSKTEAPSECRQGHADGPPDCAGQRAAPPEGGGRGP